MDGFATPPYTISQDDSTVTITVECSAEPAVAVEGNIFGLHSQGAYLPLVMPHAVERRSVGWDAHLQRAVVVLGKKESGVWNGLERLQPQLMPDEQMAAAEKDAELGRGLFAPEAELDGTAKEMLNRAMSTHAFHEAKPSPATSDVPTAPAPTSVAATVPTSEVPKEAGDGYGFGLHARFHGSIIPSGSADVRGMVEVADLEHTAPSDRATTAEQHENERWDEGIYMENHLDPDGEIASLLRYAPASLAAAVASTGNSAFIAPDLAVVLVELLFGLAYDRRTNAGEPTVESGWTVCKLSRSLSVSATPTGMNEAVRALLRRCLSMPLWRSWRLGQQCLADVASILQAGRAEVSAALKQVRERVDSLDGQGVERRIVEVWIEPLAQELCEAR